MPSMPRMLKATCTCGCTVYHPGTTVEDEAQFQAILARLGWRHVIEPNGKAKRLCGECAASRPRTAD